MYRRLQLPNSSDLLCLALWWFKPVVLIHLDDNQRSQIYWDYQPFPYSINKYCKFDLKPIIFIDNHYAKIYSKC